MPLTPDTRILLTGGGAQLASALRDRLAPVCRLTVVGHRELDISSTAAVAGVTGDLRPDVIINCASYNDVDGAEQDAAAALLVNGLGVGTLADAAARLDAVLVHYSTDFVFDPDTDAGLLSEQHPVSPRSLYAQSKLLGETLARRAPRHYLLRVASLFGGTPAKSSLDRMAAAIRRGDTVRAFANRTVTPSYVVDLADATAALLAADIPVGLYHCVNSEATTWLDVARALAVESGVNPDQAVASSQFDPAAFPARRPTYAALSNAALAAQGIRLPSWRDAIARYVATLPAR